MVDSLTKGLQEQEKLRNAAHELALNEATKLTVLENNENTKNTENYKKALEKKINLINNINEGAINKLLIN